MAKYIALLRGINVSGQKPIKMAELKSMFEQLGYTHVQTYIQSGNVLFDSDPKDGREQLRARIEQGIDEVFRFQVVVVIRTVDEMEAIVTNCPFRADALAEGESLYVSLLADTPSEAGIEKLLSFSSELDVIQVLGREVYLLLRQSSRDSKFTNNFLEKKLGVSATMRNWQTMNKLVSLGKGM